MKKIDDVRELPGFCTKLFSAISISPAGVVAPCCLYEQAIQNDEARPYRVWETSIEEIYNSKYMKNMRQKVLSGETLSQCRQCYDVESSGSSSMRVLSNVESDELVEEYDESKRYIPKSVDLKINNKCNLKCRMCQPRDSHLIQNEFEKIIKDDSSFQFFTNTEMEDPDLNLSLKDLEVWEDSEVFNKSLENILPYVVKISMVGGEPLLLDKIYDILDKCIEMDLAKNIYISFTSNFMYVPVQKIERYINHFRKVLFNISLDAVGKELNYIRYPSNFDKIVKNFNSIYRDTPNLEFQFTPTVQVYNILYIHEVYEFVESLLQKGYKLSINALHLTYLKYPEHLDFNILPMGVKKLALLRLKNFADKRPLLLELPLIKSSLNGLLSRLSESSHTDDERVSEFLHYTELLDRQRGQRFQDYLPDLYNMLVSFNSSSPKPSFHKLRELGWKKAGQKNFVEAIEFFEAAAQKSNDKSLDYREMGWMLFELKKYHKAVDVYRKGFSLNNRDQFIVRGYILSLEAIGMTDAAKKIGQYYLTFNDCEETKALVARY